VKTPFKHAFLAYREIISSGEIQVHAEGDKVALELKGNLCGDILVFIGPRFGHKGGIVELSELISSDGNLESQSKIAFDSMKQKLSGLTLLPKSLVWLLNILASSLFLGVYSGKILNPFEQNDVAGALVHTLPVAILTLVTIFYGKQIGFKSLKPLISIIAWVTKLVRRIRNRKIAA
jgi:hypothetical protein